ncbi:hypothetical protein AB595_07535 [Massilia sp. WF1]|uniref:hypothetical protein n=1 Tax=unclassified Massilia TaxID=2609279 RepID=UPI00064A5AE7|nr:MULTISPECIES: hypothetical protein [unclassified Massilia]ALK98275.1 hypothetical protein AM586_20915 [Massilia sp. WG5]KLU37148.1 hypothetical protein AB595_07535 [Massilia sp. WF1]
MKIRVAVTVLKGVRVAVAFPPPAWVVPGMGDALLARLQPHFPALPVMLVSKQAHALRAHAAFQAQALAEGADLDALPTVEIDLDAPPAAPEEAPPF